MTKKEAIDKLDIRSNGLYKSIDEVLEVIEGFANKKLAKRLFMYYQDLFFHWMLKNPGKIRKVTSLMEQLDIGVLTSTEIKTVEQIVKFNK